MGKNHNESIQCFRPRCKVDNFNFLSNLILMNFENSTANLPLESIYLKLNLLYWNFSRWLSLGDSDYIYMFLSNLR